MFPKINFTETRAYQQLVEHYSTMEKIHLKEIFQQDPERFNNFSITFDDLLFDYSKNRINEETMSLLFQMARECQLPEAISAMFNGDPINETEKRPVLHTALRNRSEQPIYINEQDIMPMIRQELDHMKQFTELVISGTWKGHTGKSITDIVNIGIGGSDLGPLMVTEALKNRKNHLELHFVSNVDSAQITHTLSKLDPETTLFLIASKTFTTLETMTNAATAKDWFVSKLGKQAVGQHFIALSSNTEAAIAFGINKDNIFGLWDWVGGRYSIWGSIGLSIALSIGFENFEELLKGAFQADEHFTQVPFEKNIPVIMGLLGIWYNNFFGAETNAIIPYNHSLHRFAAYFQQGDMESNGKSTNRRGEPINYQTGPIIWGEPGSNSQHAYFQLIHQGTKLIPTDFIAFAKPHYEIGKHHLILLSNFFAQTEALMNGKDEIQAIAELVAEGKCEETIKQEKNFRIFEGNRPSNSFLIKELTPKQLGKLLALYEHKIFVQGVLWNIFSFDQWGVELGKQLAGKILAELGNDLPVETHDVSTNGLINTYKIWKN